MKDRTILKPEEFRQIQGTIEAHQYKFHADRNLYIKNIRLIKGVAKLRDKAPKYVLTTKVGPTEYYLTKIPDALQKHGITYGLSFDIKQAVKFLEGFDDPELKRETWGKRLGLKFYTKQYHETVRSSVP